MLGRRIHFDERSRGHAIRPFLGTAVTRQKRLWTMPTNFPLDQGQEGACVGFGWSGELACDPVEISATNQSAMSLYELARAEDRAMGNNFSDGASVLAGAKACLRQGWISSYKWAFGIGDVIDTLCAKGPVVLGLNWYEGMYETEANGRVRVNGQLVGGHCIVATGYWPNHPTLRGNYIQWMNSWGPTYGVKGVGWIKDSDLDFLLKQQGEAVIATDVAPKPTRPWYCRLLEKLS